MGLKSPDEALANFLDAQLPWVRKFLQGDYSLTVEEQFDFQSSDWPRIFGKAEDEYLELLKKCPKKLRIYRKLQKKIARESATRNMPSVSPGAPRLDLLAQEAKELEQTGLSQLDIANALNRKYPERKDLKGHKKPLTAESVRKMLARRRGDTPDKT